ncbi:MAG: hypothetical protein ACXVHS_10765, partial [Methanobacterium sp.]
NYTLNVVIDKKRLLVDSSHLLYSDEGIAKWITVSPTNFTLAPGESKVVQFTVQAPSQINYNDALGALIITKTPLESQISDDTRKVNFNVQLATEIVVPIVVGLPGQIIESLQLLDHTAPTVLLSLMPGEFSYKLKNNGTVYVNMTGNIEINGLTESTTIPIDGNIYPEDEITLEKEWIPSLTDFGIYKAKTVIDYGRIQQEKTVETNDTIVVIPVWLIFILLLVVMIWFMRKRI